ncbi:MAG: hypothetical protein A2603_11825 [Bdellovibrionales bacterium RIFOXYD1_FULL_55_31]|nr:MAG: hypothetical protein A2603_11825 [Bdellovibrionales bacterium RIFOXYD1_FULL_55_31]
MFPPDDAVMKRDHANVLRDVKVLERLGLIQLVTEKEGERERMRPVALYDRIIFDFGDAKSAHYVAAFTPSWATKNRHLILS